MLDKLKQGARSGKIGTTSCRTIRKHIKRSQEKEGKTWPSNKKFNEKVEKAEQCLIKDQQTLSSIGSYKNWRKFVCQMLLRTWTISILRQDVNEN